MYYTYHQELNKDKIRFSILGEGKLEGAKDNDIYYYLGIVFEGLKETRQAKECFSYVILGEEEPTSMMYYNDQPADMILYQGLAYLKLWKTTSR